MVSDLFFSMDQKTHIKYLHTPIGWLKLQSTKNALIAISFTEKEGESSEFIPPVLNDTLNQLQEYFEGTRNKFDVKLLPSGTVFQQKTWDYVSEVEFGTTVSYLDIAIKTGSNKNTRAVGLANGKNPIPIIIPCHRVIGSNGKLTGYAGGLEKKRWLLHHELIHTKTINLLF